VVDVRDDGDIAPKRIRHGLRGFRGSGHPIEYTGRFR
jgi:hypothetical protein